MKFAEIEQEVIVYIIQFPISPHFTTVSNLKINAMKYHLQYVK